MTEEPWPVSRAAPEAGGLHRRDLILGAATVAAAGTLAATAARAQTGGSGDGTARLGGVRQQRRGPVLVLTLDAPGRNAVRPPVLRALEGALDAARANDGVGTVVITGSNGVFSAGAGNTDPRDFPPGETSQSALAFRVYRKIESYPKLVIAAVTGLAQGGGSELALSCDMRIAGRGVEFRQPEVLAGVIPGFGGMQRLPRIVGLGRALDIMLTGRRVGAEEALRIGLVSEVVSDAELEDRAVALASTLAERLNGPALAVFKRRMSASYDEAFTVALRNDQIAFDDVAGTDEARRAVDRFLEAP